MKDIKFTKDYTLYLKGIAIIMMCIHHLFYDNVFFRVPTKVCVPIFTILSGYGINESYKKRKNSSFTFVENHVNKLIKNYWWIFIPMFLLSFIFHVAPGGVVGVYGTGILGVIFFLLDFLGIRAFLYTPTLNNTWWYMEAILCCYILFLLLHKGIKKKTFLTLVILLISNILSIWYERILITTDREIYYLLPFAIGILLSEKGILNKLVAFSAEKKKVYLPIAIFSLCISIMLTIQIKLIGNVVYALAIISVCIWIFTNFKFMCKLFIFLGKHSMNIFLSHSFFYIYFIPGRKLMRICRFPIVQLIVLIIVSVLFSVFIEYIKLVVNNFRKNDNSKSEDEISIT